MFTRERHRRGVVYFGPYANAKKVRETLDVLNRVFQYRPCEGPKPGRHSGIPCLDYHIERCKAPCVGYISKEAYRRADRARDRVPLRRDAADPARARAADGGGGRRRALRGRGALPQPAVRDPPSRRAAGRRPALGRHRRRARDRDRGRPRGGADLPAARRPARRPLRLPPRERRGPGRRRRARGVLRSSTTGRRRASRRSSSSRRTRATRRRSRSSSPTGAARGSRCARPRAARSGGCRSSPTRTRARARVRPASSPSRSRLRRVEALEELREVLEPREPPDSGSSATTSRTSRPSRRSGRWSSSRTRSPKKAHYRKFGVRAARRAGRLRGDRRGRLAALRAARRRDRRGVRRVVRGDAEPRRDRRRQGPALGGARGDAVVRPAARRRHLAGEEGGARLRPGPPRRRSCSPATRPGCSSCSGSATRRTASRSASTGSGARREGARLDLRRPPGDRPGAPPGAAAALRLGRAAARGDPGGARRGAGRTGEDRAGRSTRSSTRPAAPSIGPCGALPLVLVRLALAGCGGGRQATATVETVKLPTSTTSGRSGQGRDRRVRRGRRGREDRRDLGDALLRVEDSASGRRSASSRAAPAASSRDSLGSFRDQKVIVSERITPEFGVVAIDGRDGKRVYAVPLRLEGTKWKLELGSPVKVRPLGPLPGKREPVVAQIAAAVTGPAATGDRRHVPRRPHRAAAGARARRRNVDRCSRTSSRRSTPAATRSSSPRRRAETPGRPPGRSRPGRLRLEALRDHQHEDREPRAASEEAHAPSVGGRCVKRTMREL